MTSIRILNENTINQIAAGEVIEHPASVIKECIDNSLDAQASEICIEIKGGGLNAIRITDNGIGMHEDDALLCIERYATSKLSSVKDFETLSTMGFRGEALPSIAAISKFSLLTTHKKEASSKKGSMLVVNGGTLVYTGKVSHAQGTTIEIKSLFYNTPARKKFQKSPTRIGQDISKEVIRFALAHPEIKFTLIHNAKQQISLPFLKTGSFLEKLHQRIKALLGEAYIKGMLKLETQEQMLRISGYIASPLNSKPNKTGQFLFINQRLIFSPFIAKCISEAYGNRIPSQRHPYFVLHLELPKEWVDVNVHPQKKEVRFLQKEKLKTWIIETITSTLNTSFAPVANTYFPVSHTPSLPKKIIPSSKFSYTSSPPKFTPSKASSKNPSYNSQSYDSVLLNNIEPPKGLKKKIFPIENDPSLLKPLENYSLENCHPIAITNGFILAEASGYFQNNNTYEDSILLINQSLAHARIIFERLTQQHLTNTQQELQTLLIPLTFDYTPAEALLLEQHKEELIKIGISLRSFGKHSIIVDGIGSFIKEKNINSFLLQFLSEIQESTSSNILEKEKEKKIAALTGKMIFSKNKKISIEEASSLLKNLLKTPSPFYCPYGKLIIKPLFSEDFIHLFSLP